MIHFGGNFFPKRLSYIAFLIDYIIPFGRIKDFFEGMYYIQNTDLKEKLDLFLKALLVH